MYQERVFSNIINCAATWECLAERFRRGEWDGGIVNFYIDSPNLILMGDTDSRRCDFEALEELGINFTRVPWQGTSLFIVKDTMLSFIFMKIKEDRRSLKVINNIFSCYQSLSEDFGVELFDFKNHFRTKDGKRIGMHSIERIQNPDGYTFYFGGIHYQIKSYDYRILDKVNNLNNPKWSSKRPSNEETSLEDESGQKISLKDVDELSKNQFEEKLGLKFINSPAISQQTLQNKVSKYNKRDWKRWGGVLECQNIDG